MAKSASLLLEAAHLFCIVVPRAAATFLAAVRAAGAAKQLRRAAEAAAATPTAKPRPGPTPVRVARGGRGSPSGGGVAAPLGLTPGGQGSTVTQPADMLDGQAAACMPAASGDRQSKAPTPSEGCEDYEQKAPEEGGDGLGAVPRASAPRGAAAVAALRLRSGLDGAPPAAAARRAAQWPPRVAVGEEVQSRMAEMERAMWDTLPANPRAASALRIAKAAGLVS